MPELINLDIWHANLLWRSNMLTHRANTGDILACNVLLLQRRGHAMHGHCMIECGWLVGAIPRDNEAIICNVFGQWRVDVSIHRSLCLPISRSPDLCISLSLHLSISLYLYISVSRSLRCSPPFFVAHLHPYFHVTLAERPGPQHMPLRPLLPVSVRFLSVDTVSY